VVKSEAETMPTKTRRPKRDPKFLKELEEIERRVREEDREIVALLAKSREIRKKLREIAQQ